MIRRWLASRSGRKLLRSRLAMAAVVVIGGYLLVAVAVGCGAITLEQTLERVGPSGVPGFFRTPLPEKRLEDGDLFLVPVERALRRDDPSAALSEIRFGMLRLAEKPPEVLAEIVSRSREIYDELAESDDLNTNPALLPKMRRYEDTVAELVAPLSPVETWIYRLQMLLGTDRQGRSIMLRAVYSVKVAIQIGAVTALISVAFGSLLGAAAGYFGGWVDHLVIWLYSTFSSIPNLVLLVVLAYMFTGSQIEKVVPLLPVYAAFCMTFWIGPCRVIRGETLKIKELEYVQAATTVGFGRLYILIRHILPNTTHLMLINFSLLFIGAVKSEVILSFLGLGVKKGPSWGIMISQSKTEVINGFFWQIGAATAFMFVLVLAFNVLTDALQDVFDPKHL